MSATNGFEDKILKLLFQNVDATLIGDAGGLLGSAAPGVFYISLHTADPGEAGDQSTSETGYTGYGRISVVRSGALWTVSGTAPTKAENAAAITFGVCAAGTPTLTHFGIGTDLAGAGNLFLKGQLTAPLVVGPGVTPEISAGALIVTLD